MKTTRFSDTVREYARKLNDDDLRFLDLYLSRRVGADVAEAVEFLQHNSEIDRWLSLCKDGTDFFDMLDQVNAGLQVEANKRFYYEKK